MLEPQNERPRFFVGTASWTDQTLVNSDSFYPPSAKTAEDRLKFYAAQFNTVEVDSSYYVLIAEKTAQLWADRTPPEFIFNVKAFSLLTQHAAEVSRLPLQIKELLTENESSQRQLKRPSPAVLELAFQMFWSSLTPLRNGQKLGMLLFQFPPYFIFSTRNMDYLAKLPALMPEAGIAIEFRHPSWVASDSNRDQTMRFLRDHDLRYVSVDEPEASSTVPSFIEVTGPEAYMRFHGKNLENWFKKNIPVSERFKYLYSERELGGWADKLKELRGVKRAYAIFNNCYRNFGIMNATTMAEMLNR
jgi:uncharacterized protein YecE (DUF72 family)